MMRLCPRSNGSVLASSYPPRSLRRGPGALLRSPLFPVSPRSILAPKHPVTHHLPGMRGFAQKVPADADRLLDHYSTLWRFLRKPTNELVIQEVNDVTTITLPRKLTWLYRPWNSTLLVRNCVKQLTDEDIVPAYHRRIESGEDTVGYLLTFTPYDVTHI